MPIRFSFGAPLLFPNANKANAEIIGRELLRISKQQEIKPRMLWRDYARNPKNPLHKHFTWNDAMAAQKCRDDEARNILRAISIEDTELDIAPARMFLSIADKGRSYRRLDEILDSARLQQLMLEQAERDLRVFEDRYRELKDIVGIVKKAREKLSRHIKRTREEPKHAHV